MLAPEPKAPLPLAFRWGVKRRASNLERYARTSLARDIAFHALNVEAHALEEFVIGDLVGS
ncbi:MAG: hypothetical protein RR779_19110, partial [Comamonas sp.]